IMGLGPVSAVKRALAKAGLKLEQIDVIESNEAFAAQALGVSRELGMNPAKVNPNGGAVALGHPIGATGCLLTVKAMYELHRTGGGGRATRLSEFLPSPACANRWQSTGTPQPNGCPA